MSPEPGKLYLVAHKWLKTKNMYRDIAKLQECDEVSFQYPKILLYVESALRFNQGLERDQEFWHIIIGEKHGWITSHELLFEKLTDQV